MWFHKEALPSNASQDDFSWYLSNGAGVGPKQLQTFSKASISLLEHNHTVIYHSFFKSTSQKCTNISSFNSRTSAFKIKKISKILLKVSAEGMGRGKGQGNRERKVQNETWYQVQLLMSRQPELQQKPSC